MPPMSQKRVTAITQERKAPSDPYTREGKGSGQGEGHHGPTSKKPIHWFPSVSSAEGNIEKKKKKGRG